MPTIHKLNLFLVSNMVLTIQVNDLKFPSLLSACYMWSSNIIDQ